MVPDHEIPSLAIDLTRMHRRTVTSFYSNLVTRPTGRAVRMGVESQLLEVDGGLGVRVSVLDFSQVRVLDYSCADEIVAKLLLRYVGPERPTDAYFMGRGIRDHHRDAIEAVLERHDLRLVIHESAGDAALLGPADPLERACWSALVRMGRGDPAGVAAAVGLAPDAALATLVRMVSHRVAIPLQDGVFCPLSSLAVQ